MPWLSSVKFWSQRELSSPGTCAVKEAASGRERSEIVDVALRLNSTRRYMLASAEPLSWTANRTHSSTHSPSSTSATSLRLQLGFSPQIGQRLLATDRVVDRI